MSGETLENNVVYVDFGKTGEVKSEVAIYPRLRELFKGWVQREAEFADVTYLPSVAPTEAESQD